VAQQANTAASYNVFVERHPDSELAGIARQRIAQLTEEGAWREANRANTAAAYRDYLARYPNGSWSQDARIRMESRALAAHPPLGADLPPAAHPPQGADLPLAVHPPQGAALTPPDTGAPRAAPQPTAQISTDPAGPGRVAVQLGAFSSAANARSAWSQLSSRFRAELGGLTPQVVAVSLSGRQLYRLQTHVADEAAARRLCGQLAQRSQGCLPVP
jgi:cell division septation protein DedD